MNSTKAVSPLTDETIIAEKPIIITSNMWGMFGLAYNKNLGYADPHQKFADLLGVNRNLAKSIAINMMDSNWLISSGKEK